jgi:hypothetical protein
MTQLDERYMSEINRLEGERDFYRTKADDTLVEIKLLRDVIVSQFSHDPILACEEGVDEIGHTLSMSDQVRKTIKRVLAENEVTSRGVK